MTSSRLKQQFIRLWQSCQGQTQEITLSELADLLHCSRRHMRNLLNRMQDAGWLIWQAIATHLLLHRSGVAAAAC